jgi:hypothetical protein
MTEKVENYSAERTTEMVAAYTAAETDEGRAAVVVAFADKFSKKKASIVAKLVSCGVYKAREYTTKTGKKPVSKSQFVENIAAAIGVASDSLPGLDKANKSALEVIFAAVAESHDPAAVEADEKETA